MSKRKQNCKIPTKITGSMIPGMDIVIGAASAVLSWMGNIVWDCIKFLGITGLTALRDLVVDLWKDGTKRKIKTDNLKAFVVIVRRKLIRKNPDYRKDPIFTEISELNKLCFYIENLNEEGMEKQQQLEIRKLAATHIRSILKQFKKLMSAADVVPKKEDEKKEDKKEETKKEDKKDETKKEDKLEDKKEEIKKEEPKKDEKKEEPKKTTNRRYRK